jgi:hypothetical protein
MNRFLTALVAGAAILTLSAPSYADSAKANATKLVAPVMAVGKACPKHYVYVKGYTKKSGTKVKGYCRKSM